MVDHFLTSVIIKLARTKYCKQVCGVSVADNPSKSVIGLTGPANSNKDKQ